MSIRNALRYFPDEYHQLLAREFYDELHKYGHIYMYRFRPQLSLYAPCISHIKCRSQQSAAIIHMILNNLDPIVAQFPHELVTYGGNGQVFSNWAQVSVVGFSILNIVLVLLGA